MPSNMLFIDTGFPAFSGRESTEEKILSIQNYMYILVEQLRYSLRNLDAGNFNATGLKRITDPIYVSLHDAEDGLSAQLSIMAEGLSARLQSVEGAITELGATAEGLEARIADAEGNITQLSATAEGLAARVTDSEGHIAALTITTEGLVAGAADMAAGLSQTLRIGPDGVTVTNAEGSKFIIDGGNVSAVNLNLTGRITFGDLDTDTQAAVNNRGIDSWTANTLITDRLVSAPKIRGATYWDAEEVARLQLSMWPGSSYPALMFETADGDAIFNVVWNDAASNVEVFMAGSVMFDVTGAPYGQTPLLKAKNIWDFSGATVTGLRFE